MSPATKRQPKRAPESGIHRVAAPAVAEGAGALPPHPSTLPPQDVDEAVWKRVHDRIREISWICFNESRRSANPIMANAAALAGAFGFALESAMCPSDLVETMARACDTIQRKDYDDRHDLWSARNAKLKQRAAEKGGGQ